MRIESEGSKELGCEDFGCLLLRLGCMDKAAFYDWETNGM